MGNVRQSLVIKADIFVWKGWGDIPNFMIMLDIFVLLFVSVTGAIWESGHCSCKWRFTCEI